MATSDQRRPAPSLVEKLFDAAFNTSRDPRSAEYKDGVRAALNYRINGVRVRCPHPMGTVQADAYFAGIAEGHGIWRAYAEAGGDANGHR